MSVAKIGLVELGVFGIGDYGVARATRVESGLIVFIGIESGDVLDINVALKAVYLASRVAEAGSQDNGGGIL